VLLGVPAQYATTAVFRAACLAAGLVLGGANWLLARYVIGTRLRLLAGRIGEVAQTVGDPVAAAQVPGRPAADLALPVDSADDLGSAARAFNALLAALDRERRFRSVVHATNDVMALLTPEGRVSFVSDSISGVLGWTRAELLDLHVGDLLFGEDAHLFTTTGAPITHDGQPSQVFLVRVRHRDGGWRHLEVSSSDRRDDPDIGGLLLTARDVTERLELQSRLAHQATHDALTGLPNRAAVLARGEELLTDPATPCRLAVLLMDLDRFKEVNDTLGHSYGDRLLAQVGPRLRPLVREVDMVARLGGDEFAVLLPDVTVPEARAAAERLHAALGTPFLVDGLSLDVDVSIGVAVCGEEGADVGTLLRQADIAMYAAKDSQDGVAVYDPRSDGNDRNRLVLLSELRRGLADGELVVHYQPKVALDSGQVVGVEALVRWQHPVRGLLAPVDFLDAVERTALIEPVTDAVLDLALTQVRAWSAEGLRVPVAVNLSARSLARPDLLGRVLLRWQHPKRGLLVPAAFIPLAERTGIIKPMTDWILDRALRQVHEWQAAGAPVHVAVNVSAKSLQEQTLPSRVQALLDKWSVDPRFLKIEITESSIMADPAHALAIMSMLQSMGVRLSIDDFGTGYSSLTHLRELPIDEIKIDKSFVLKMTSSDADLAIVRTVVHLAHDLGKQVCAEGVEDEDTWRMLGELGCDLAQGFWIARPMNGADLMQWLVENSWGLQRRSASPSPR